LVIIKNINKQRLSCSFSANKTAEEILKEREQLDKRRLEHAHLQYALLQMIHFFPGSFILKKISFKNFSETITNLALSLHEAFTAHYAGRTSFFVVFSEVKTSHGQLRPKNLVVISNKKKKKRAKGILSSSK